MKHTAVSKRVTVSEKNSFFGCSEEKSKFLAQNQFQTSFNLDIRDQHAKLYQKHMFLASNEFFCIFALLAPYVLMWAAVVASPARGGYVTEQSYSRSV